MVGTIGKTKRPMHRGAPRAIQTFAHRFLMERREGFCKDMQICMAGIPAKNRTGTTHAYFPALMACCGMLEYLAFFYSGKRLDKVVLSDVQAYAKAFLRQPDYDAEAIRVLVCAFRNTVNHRGIASGVWVDPNPNANGRRLTWKVYEDAVRPALSVRGQLWRDIADSIPEYAEAITNDPKLECNFKKCLELLYPA